MEDNGAMQFFKKYNATRNAPTQDWNRVSLKIKLFGGTCYWRDVKSGMWWTERDKECGRVPEDAERVEVV